jgi:hypothetical protein
MSIISDAPPILSDDVNPPIILGTAALTHFAYQGNDYDSMIELITRSPPPNSLVNAEIARLFDTAIACQLAFHRAEGLNLQDIALESSQIYRVARPTSEPPAIRLLAVVAPGDLMSNTPLDFLTNYLDVQLDLLFVMPGQPLPQIIPDHDLAFFAVGEATGPTLARLQTLFIIWPRPVLNDPGYLPGLERDTLSHSLMNIPGLVSPTAVAVSRTALNIHLRSGRPIEGFPTAAAHYPCLIRPHNSHAGASLVKIHTPADLADYLRFSFERRFFITRFHDYASPDGYYHKSRVAFIDRQPFLCHMAISQHWMVHYLNAGMTESAAKRQQEAQAMAEFDTGFARRHAAAFDALHQRLGFDYYSIDCAETRDGQLLVFEADAAAIVHLMDAPDLFPYKQPQMHRVFRAFETMLHRRAAQTSPTGLHEPALHLPAAP